MSRRGFWIILLGAALACLLFFGADGDDGPDYTLFSARDRGAALLYDTLRRMGHPVAAGYAPLDTRARVNDAFILIMPDNPGVTIDMADEMLAWVRRGGRLIFLGHEHPGVMDEAMRGVARPTEMEGLIHYALGMGEVVTGPGDAVLNESLLRDSTAGAVVQMALSAWDADAVWFAEYYHGYQARENFVTRLPVVVKLIGLQLLAAAGLALWHVGKRFGRPIVFYEETEREENEHVKALARLYRAAGIGGEHD